MSYSSVYMIKSDGGPEHWADARNAWGTAPMIWDAVAEAAGVPTPMRFGAREEDLKPFWDLFDSGKLSEKLNALLGFTYDAVWVKRENIDKLISALRWFDAEYAVPTNRVRTANEMADHLQRLLAEGPQDIRGACFMMTSVSGCRWSGKYDEQTDDHIPYNFDRSTGHFELFSNEYRSAT